MKHTRRDFIKKSGLATAGVLAFGDVLVANLATKPVANPLPRWRGFNLLDYFGAQSKNANSKSNSTENDFKWMRDWGFNFVRIPMAYPRYINFDPSKNITPEDVYKINEAEVEKIVKLVELANKNSLHVSLNLHRAPGYCVNAGFHEPFNLWKDDEAQKAFLFHWEMWAKTFKSFSKDNVSFDLLNEPSMREDMNNQFSKRETVPGKLYRKVAKQAMETIKAISPDRIVVADGNDVGSSVIPEIVDLDIAQSCRGYFPHYISHYRASWVWKNPDDAPMAVWPGEYDGVLYNKKKLEEFYQPWIDLVKSGVGVHCGECGCYNKTPHKVFLAWFEDVLDILTQNNIGYGLWNFRGDFGILDSGRKDIKYEDWYGHKLDKKFLELLKKY
jgi:endoglucanase